MSYYTKILKCPKGCTTGTTRYFPAQNGLTDLISCGNCQAMWTKDIPDLIEKYFIADVPEEIINANKFS